MFPRPDEPSPHLSSLALEQLAAAELASGRRDAATGHLASCERCRGRLVELEREAARFAIEIDVRGAVDALLGAVARAPRPWYRRSSVVVAAVAVAASVVLVLQLGDPRGVGEAPDDRTKGSLGFEVIRRDRHGKIGEVASGDRLVPGEAIRFRVRSRDPGFLAIVGIDAARAVTPYGSSIVLEGGVARVVDGSIILDATLGPERIVAVVCGWPIPAAAAIALARRELAKVGGDPRQIGRIAAACHEASMLIEKVER